MSPASEESLAAKADRTLACVRQGIESGQVPMVSELIRIIREISAKADTLSIGELAEYIHREPSTMARIVAIANSLGYNPAGVQITSVHQAIVAVGFERLRNLAISLLLLDQAQSPFTAAANRELASLALLSGLFAANLSRRRLWVEHDLAFVCGALRDYGRMLMATFLAGEYATLARDAGNDFTDETCRSVFGLTPLQLSHDILSLMELPEMITGTLARVSPELRRLASENPTVALQVITDFGLRLAQIVQAPDLTLESFPIRIEDLSHEYDPSLFLSKSAAQDLALEVFGTLRTFGWQGGFNLNSVTLFKRFDALVTHRRLPPPFPHRPAETEPETPSTAGGREGGTGYGRAVDVLDAAATTLARLVLEPQPDRRRIFRFLVETLGQALDLNSCLVFVRDSRSGLFPLEFGSGPLVDDVRDSVHLDPARRDIFSVPLNRSEDVLIQDPDARSIRAFVPPWLLRPSQVRPVLILPIKDDRHTFALLCATSTSFSSFSLAQGVTAQLHRLRAALAPLGRTLR